MSNTILIAITLIGMLLLIVSMLVILTVIVIEIILNNMTLIKDWISRR